MIFKVSTTFNLQSGATVSLPLFLFLFLFWEVTSLLRPGTITPGPSSPRPVAGRTPPTPTPSHAIPSRRGSTFRKRRHSVESPAQTPTQTRSRKGKEREVDGSDHEMDSNGAGGIEPMENVD